MAAEFRALGIIKIEDRGEFRVRVSTVFLLLSLFCLIVELIPGSSIPSIAENVIRNAYGISWLALIFGQLGPLWSVFGIGFALLGIAINSKRIRVVCQSFAEMFLCVIIFVLFPVY